MDRRVQQLLHYTHEHVQEAQAQLEARLQIVYQEQDQKFELQLAKMYGDFTAALNNVDTARQATIYDTMRTMTKESEARTHTEVQGFAREQSVVYEQKLFEHLSQAKSNMEFLTRNYVADGISSAKAHFSDLLEERFRTQEQRLYDQIASKFHAVHESQDAMSRSSMDDANAFEMRVEQKLREAHQRRVEENEALRQHVTEMKDLAVAETTAKLKVHSNNLEQRWRENLQQEVTRQLATHLPILEEKLRSKLLEDQALARAGEDRLSKQIVEDTLARAEAATKAIIARTIDERQRRRELHFEDHNVAPLSTTCSVNPIAPEFIENACQTEAMDPAEPVNSEIPAIQEHMLMEDPQASTEPVAVPTPPAAFLPYEERARLAAINLRQLAAAAKVKQPYITPISNAESAKYAARAALAARRLKAIAVAQKQKQKQRDQATTRVRNSSHSNQRNMKPSNDTKLDAVHKEALQRLNQRIQARSSAFERGTSN